MSGSNSKHDDLNTTCDYLKNIEDHSSIKIGEDSKQNLNQEGLFCICLLNFDKHLVCCKRINRLCLLKSKQVQALNYC